MQSRLSAAPELDTVQIPITTIYDQGGSDWCWAFSSFHTLRTYYANAATTDGDAAWRSALQPLDSQSGITGYLSSHFDEGHSDNPLEFIELMENEKAAPAQGWTGFYRTDRDSSGPAAPSDQPTTRLATADILAKMVDNLRHQVPSVFCNSEHCRMIYGATMDGSGAASSFMIADSIGARTYTIDAGEVADTLDMVMTLK